MDNLSDNNVLLKSVLEQIDATETLIHKGTVTKVSGLLVESQGPPLTVGDICWIRPRAGDKLKPAQVVGLEGTKLLLMPYEDTNGIAVGCEVLSKGQSLFIHVGESLLGRVLDGFGNPIDGKGPITGYSKVYLHQDPPPALDRPRIHSILATGIKAIDSTVTIGEGQRLGIFAGSGVGKSVLLGMIARNSDADVNVIALIGERGREVNDFLERDLGAEGLAKSVVIVVTSDQAAVMRIRGAQTAMTIAEYFRDQDNRVAFMMDSVTRVAMAQREIGLSIGEPPTTKGYTPSVFALLPRLLERSGMAATGSITGFFTVLVEADDMSEPVADTVRSILDGHLVLSRRLAEQNHYPAIDVLQSISRLMNDIVDNDHRLAAAQTRDVLATYQEAEDLINIGAYVKGNNQRIDFAIDHYDQIRNYLKQDQFIQTNYTDTVNSLKALFNIKQGES